MFAWPASGSASAGSVPHKNLMTVFNFHSKRLSLFKFLSLVTCHSSLLPPTSGLASACYPSPALSSPQPPARDEVAPPRPFSFAAATNRWLIIFVISEHIQRREDTKTYWMMLGHVIYLIGTCGNLWIFLRRLLGMRSRLITINRKFTYSFVVFLKISQTFHNLGVHLSSSSTAWQYRNVAKLQETEKSIEHVINSNLVVKVVSV